MTNSEAFEFEQAWGRMEARGYQYGEDALENVRVGWDMAREFAVTPIENIKLSARGVGVDQNYFWRHIDADTPRHVKLQLLAKSGIAFYGKVAEAPDFYTHWAPLPKLPPEGT